MTDTFLPPGVHPHDASTAPHHAEPVPHDHPRPLERTGRKPWPETNAYALPVFQRLAQESNTETIVFTQALTAFKVVSRMPGRTKLAMWVPAHFFFNGAVVANANGIIVCEDEGELQGNIGGVYMDVGTSMDWAGECSVWAMAPVATAAAPAVLNWAHHWNPVGSFRGPDY